MKTKRRKKYNKKSYRKKFRKKTFNKKYLKKGLGFIFNYIKNPDGTIDFAINTQFKQKIQKKILELSEENEKQRLSLKNVFDNHIYNDININIRYNEKQINNLNACIRGVIDKCPPDMMRENVSSNRKSRLSLLRPHKVPQTIVYY